MVLNVMMWTLIGSTISKKWVESLVGIDRCVELATEETGEHLELAEPWQGPSRLDLE